MNFYQFVDITIIVSLNKPERISLVIGSVQNEYIVPNVENNLILKFNNNLEFNITLVLLAYRIGWD